MRGPVKTAQQAADSWAARMADPTTQAKYKQGISSVTVGPNQAAASPAAIAKYAAATQAAVTSGLLAARNQAVDINTWKNAALAGASVLGTNAARKKPKTLAAFQRLQAGWQAARDAAQQIPHDGSMASALARVQASITAMKQAAGKPIT